MTEVTRWHPWGKAPHPHPPYRRSVRQVRKKLVIFYKMYYNDTIWKKAKQ